jgi:hypothetical protein
MPYGTIKVDNITFTDNSVDKTVSLSGLIQNPTFTGNVTVTGTISGDVIRGGTSISGVTVTGTTANFVSGVFTTQVSGTTITGTTVATTTGSFVSLTGTTATFTSGIIASGTAALPSLAILSDPNTGIYSPGADQLAVATNGQGRLFIDASGNVGVGTASPNASSKLHVANGDVLISKTSGYASLFFNFIGVGTARAASIKKNYDSPFDLRIQGGNNSAAAPICFDRADGFENARFDDSGRLGIGDSAPESLLHLKGSNATLKIESSVNTGYSSVEFDRAADDTHFAIYAYDSSHASQANNVQFYGYQNGNIQFITNSNATPRLTITSAGLVGIGTTSPGSELHVAASSGYAELRLAGASGSGGSVEFYNSATQLGDIFIDTSNNMIFRNASEAFRVDSSRRLLVGTSTARAVGVTGPSEAPLQIETPDGLICGLTLLQNRIDAIGPNLRFGKTGGATVGSVTTVSDGHELGTIQFCGADGTDLTSVGALIRAQVDGTPGNDDMPGRLVFSTTADGAASPTERLRITSAGLVGIGTTSPGSIFHVKPATDENIRFSGGSGDTRIACFNDAASSTVQLSIQASPLLFRGTGGTEVGRWDSSGRLLVGTSSTRSGWSNTTIGSNFLQIERAVTGGDAGISLCSNSVDAAGSGTVFLGKTRGASLGLSTIVVSGDEGISRAN